MIILGINAYHGDASAALVVDGRLVAAVEEERFTRVKHSAGFPAHAVRYCLSAGGIRPEDIDHVAVPRDPRARLAQKALYAMRIPRLAFNRLKVWKEFGDIPTSLARALDTGRMRATVHRVEHHKAHLASAFFVSPFDKAALLSVDGLGDFASTMWGIGDRSKLRIMGSIAFPHSLGIFYTAITQYLGFWKYGDEYKVMGLAAYGEPEYFPLFQQLVQLPDKLGFRLGLQYFAHHRTGADMTWRGGEPMIGRLYSNAVASRLGPARERGEPVGQRHEAIAASLQQRLEDAIFHLLNNLYAQTGTTQLCLAGGVAFNCVSNGKIFEKTPFRDVYIQPAAGDAGLAIGAAFHVDQQVLGRPREFVMEHAYWGPEFDETSYRHAIDEEQADIAAKRCTIRELDSTDALCRWTAEHIAGGKVVGWFHGRMEWGPRALGNRSIVVDPRRPEMKDVLNSRVKHRESFRPFAPSILEEHTGDYFTCSYPSPYMLMAYPVRPERRAEIPAPTHVDGTGRLQTVSRKTNPLYWQLIKEFERRTGVPVVLNTSFNENEPIVCTPQEALRCFLRTRMDVLVMGPFVLEKAHGESEPA